MQFFPRIQLQYHCNYQNLDRALFWGTEHFLHLLLRQICFSIRQDNLVLKLLPSNLERDRMFLRLRGVKKYQSPSSAQNFHDQNV